MLCAGHAHTHTCSRLFYLAVLITHTHTHTHTCTQTLTHLAIAQDNFNINDLPLLLEKLSSITARWYPLGIQLNIDPNTLSGFEQEHNDVKFYLSRTLSLWAKEEQPPQKLIEALKKDVIGMIALADELEPRYVCKF